MVKQLHPQLGQLTGSDIGQLTGSNYASQSVYAADQRFVAAGSPSAFGQNVQAHSFIASAGSIGVVQFGTAFAAAPIVVASAIGGIAAIDVSAGSVVINTTAASASGTLFAIGSGNI